MMDLGQKILLGMVIFCRLGRPPPGLEIFNQNSQIFQFFYVPVKNI